MNRREFVKTIGATAALSAINPQLLNKKGSELTIDNLVNRSANLEERFSGDKIDM
jgi:hypothetical protein